MSSNTLHFTQQGRQKIIDNARLMRIILSPVSLIFRCVLGLARVLGLEAFVFKAIFRKVSKQFYVRMEEAFTGYHPTANDVFVCSYFKSGTNWMMQIAHQIANRGQGRYEHVHDVIAWPDAPIKELAVSLSADYPMSQSKTGLRVIKTHSEAHSVPYDEQAKYVCVVRDPKDVFVSSYFYVRSIILGNLMPSVPAWLEVFLSDSAMHGEWANFLHGYWQWRNRSNVLFLTFEDMKNDLPGVIRMIATLMGVTLTPDEFERVVYFSSYKHMKSIDHKFTPGRISPFSLPEVHMIRSGHKGNSSELLTPHEQARINEHCRQSLQNIGCDFPYDIHYNNTAP